MVSEIITIPGDNVHLSCIAAKGDLPFRVTWSFESDSRNEIPPGVSFIKLGRTPNILIIPIVSHLHSGNYTCEISNVAGRATHSTNLIVNGM